MPTAENAKLEYEAGQTPVAMAATTDSGDHTIYTSAGSPWSQRSGFAPVIRPDGLIAGGVVTAAASGSNDVVDVSAGSAYIGGALVTWTAQTDVSLTRATPSDTHMINSITVTSGGSVAVVTGTDGTSFSETRAAAGGPALIATTSIEIAQVRLSSNSAAAVTSSEIYAVPGTHTERWDYPLYTANYYTGTLTFVDALPTIHTGPVTKGVYMSYSTPTFAAVQKAKDFVPPENSYSVTSEQYYRTTVGASTASLQAGTFTAALTDGVTDGLAGLVGEVLWFRFYPDEDRSPYIMSQGKLGMRRSYPAGGQITGDFTIAAESAATNVQA